MTPELTIVISELIHARAVERLRPHALIHYDEHLFAQPERLKELLAEADALIVRNQTQVSPELLDGAPGLKVLGRIGVGLDNLDLPALKTRGVTVTWAPGTNAVSVAEYVMAAMLELSRQLCRSSARVHGGEWNRKAAMAGELFGKTLGIVGLGDIGSRLAKRARAFGMHILAHDPVIHESSLAVQEYGVEVVALDRLLESADVVTLHAPLLPSTRHMIDTEALAKMKASALLINTARGGLVDEAALAEALRAGALGGAALDVRSSEPPTSPDPLCGLENLLLTPHIAGVTFEANKRASLRVAYDVLATLQGRAPTSKLEL